MQISIFRRGCYTDLAPRSLLSDSMLHGIFHQRLNRHRWHLGVRNIDIPITPPKVWQILHDKGIS